MNDKLELDIPVLLPDLPDAADACLDRLVSTLSKREGVERAHVICLDGNTPAALCIHFDAAKLPLPRLREMVRAAGAEITERYGHAIWQVTGINHERRARTVSDALCALPGVVQASASTSGSVRVEYDRRETTGTIGEDPQVHLPVAAGPAVERPRRAAFGFCRLPLAGGACRFLHIRQRLRRAQLLRP